MAFEFGFDVVRIEVDELDVEPDEPREFMIEAMAGEVAAHISTDLAGLVQVVEEVEREESSEGYRPGRAWEPQLPQMRGFFFHPRILLQNVQALAPHHNDEDDVDYWEFIFDGEDGSQVVLRLSEPVTRGLIRHIHELVRGPLA